MVVPKTEPTWTLMVAALPGGAVEGDESLEEALGRETLEEVGCDCEVIAELGIVKEYINQYKKLNISNSFLAKVKGPIGAPSFTDHEIEYGFKLKWISLDEAIDLVKNGEYRTYRGKFIRIRDSVILEKAKEAIEKLLLFK